MFLSPNIDKLQKLKRLDMNDNILFYWTKKILKLTELFTLFIERVGVRERKEDPHARLHLEKYQRPAGLCKNTTNISY